MMPRKLVMSTNVRPVTQFCFFGKFMIYINQQLVGGFNPFERYCIISPGEGEGLQEKLLPALSKCHWMDPNAL